MNLLQDEKKFEGEREFFNDKNSNNIDGKSQTNPHNQIANNKQDMKQTKERTELNNKFFFKNRLTEKLPQLESISEKSEEEDLAEKKEEKIVINSIPQNPRNKLFSRMSLGIAGYQKHNNEEKKERENIKEILKPKPIDRLI